jgi:hypothetical protein
MCTEMTGYEPLDDLFSSFFQYRPPEVGPEHDIAAGAEPPSRRALGEARWVSRAVEEGCTAPVCVAAAGVGAWLQELYEGILRIPTYMDVG